MNAPMGVLVEYARLKQEQRADDLETFWKGIRMVCWYIAHYAGKTLREGAELSMADIVSLPSDKTKAEKKYSEPELLNLIDEQWPQGE